MNTFIGRKAYREQRALGDGLRVHKRSLSFEPVGNDSPSRESENGGGLLNASSDEEWSPTSTWRGPRAVSDDGQHMSVSSAPFMVGTSVDDDVFTEASSERQESAGAVTEHDQLQIGHSDCQQKVDAQGIYPGTACMFVANLTQGADDTTLEYEVTKIFSQYGKVWVKIRRDANQMPFAFCQFTTDQHATQAQKWGKGTEILGRACRTEMARAHSTFIVFKIIFGPPITTFEASEALGVLREVAKAQHLNADAQATLRLPPAVVITYKMFDSRRDPVRYFAEHDVYRVIANDPKRLAAARAAASASQALSHEALMAEYDKDRRSSYVGNLPVSMNEELLQALGEGVGPVASVHVLRKPIPHGDGGEHCFGFIEFVRPEDADKFVVTLKGSIIHGHRIRVEPKRSRTFDGPRNTPGRPLRHVQSTITGQALRTFRSDQAMAGNSASPNTAGVVRDYPDTFGPQSTSHGRCRRSRPSILTVDTSIGHELSKLALDDKESTENLSTFKTEHDAVDTTPLRKEVVFKRDAAASAVSPAAADDEVVQSGPHTPAEKSKPEEAVAENAATSVASVEQAPVHQMAWMPTYNPYPYGYMGSPMTPQSHSLMYHGYMGTPFYSPFPMYDLFGNVVMSPTSIMPQFTPGSMVPAAGPPMANDDEVPPSASDEKQEK